MVGDLRSPDRSCGPFEPEKDPTESLMGHSHFRDSKMEAERSSMNCLKSELDLNRAGAGNQNALITQAGLLSA